MEENLRTLIRSLAAGAVALAATLVALPIAAQAAWPEKPVRIIVSFPPGGSSDLVARLIGQHLAEKLGQQFIVDNRPGAGGTVAGDILKKEAGDGHTFMLSNLAPFSISPALFKTIPYDPMADFTHVSYIGAVHMGMIIDGKLAKTLPELIAKAKAEPGVLNYGSSGVGSWSHVIGELFKARAGVDIVHVPYKGSGPMRQDFKAGVIPIYFDALAQNLPSIKAGEGVAVAVTSTRRIPNASDVPTFTELGLDIVAENWLGFTAPAGVPADIVAAMDKAVKEVIAMPSVQEQFVNWGLIHEAKTPAEFTAYVANQLEVWRPLIIAAGAQQK